MEEAVSHSVLRGRPFGGVGVLLKNKYCDGIKFTVMRERFLILIFSNTIIVNIYLPCASSDPSLDVLCDTLAEIESVILSYNGFKLICGGDFNVNLNGNMRSATIIREFMTKFDLSVCDKSFSSNRNIIDYTFCHDSLGHRS